MVSTPLLTTIHGFSSPKILPVYKKYNGRAFYVAISDADRSPELNYVATIHHGIDLQLFDLRREPGDYLLFFGRIHHDKGAREAIDIARRFGMRLVMAGIIQDKSYWENEVQPHVDGHGVVYVGSAGPEKRNDLLGGAYALLHQIHFDEPFGLSVIEAMACGTPVVCANGGALAEIAPPAARVYDPEDSKGMAEACIEILENAQTASALAEAGIAHAQSFTWERAAAAYVALYRKIAGGG